VVAGRELWGTGIFTKEILWLPVLSFVLHEQPIKKSHLFQSPRASPGKQLLIKKPENSGNEIGVNTFKP